MNTSNTDLLATLFLNAFELAVAEKDETLDVILQKVENIEV
jgi:hypothetical protein